MLCHFEGIQDLVITDTLQVVCHAGVISLVALDFWAHPDVCFKSIARTVALLFG